MAFVHCLCTLMAARALGITASAIDQVVMGPKQWNYPFWGINFHSPAVLGYLGYLGCLGYQGFGCQVSGQVFASEIGGAHGSSHSDGADTCLIAALIFFSRDHDTTQ